MTTAMDSTPQPEAVCSLRDTETALVASIPFPVLRKAAQVEVDADELFHVLRLSVGESLRVHLARNGECVERMKVYLAKRMKEAGYCCSWMHLFKMATGVYPEDHHVGSCRLCRRELAEIQESLPRDREFRF